MRELGLFCSFIVGPTDMPWIGVVIWFPLNIKINQFQAGRMIQYLFVDLIKNKMAKSGIKMVLRRSMQGHLLLEEGDQVAYLRQ